MSKQTLSMRARPHEGMAGKAPWVCTAYPKAFGTTGAKRGFGHSSADAREAARRTFQNWYGCEPVRLSEPSKRKPWDPQAHAAKAPATARKKPAASADRLSAIDGRLDRIERQLATLEALLSQLLDIADPTRHARPAPKRRQIQSERP